MTNEEYSKLIAIGKAKFEQHVEQSRNEQRLMDVVFVVCFAVAMVCNAYVIGSVFFSM